MKRISLLAFVIVGFATLAQAQPQVLDKRGTQSSPTQVEGSNCETCRQQAAACNNEKDFTGRAICQKAAMQCRCQ